MNKALLQSSFILLSSVGPLAIHIDIPLFFVALFQVHIPTWLCTLWVSSVFFRYRTVAGAQKKGGQGISVKCGELENWLDMQCNTNASLINAPLKRTVTINVKGTQRWGRRSGDHIIAHRQLTHLEVTCYHQRQGCGTFASVQFVRDCARSHSCKEVGGVGRRHIFKMVIKKKKPCRII